MPLQRPRLDVARSWVQNSIASMGSTALGGQCAYESRFENDRSPRDTVEKLGN